MRAPAPTRGFWIGAALALAVGLPLWVGIIYAAHQVWQVLS